MSGKTPGDADRIVSANILRRRIALGLSQQDLAGTLGVTFQQIQKYENGKNRIPAGRLWELAKALGTSIEALYHGMPELVQARIRSGVRTGNAMAEDGAPFEGFNQQAVNALVSFLEIPEGADRKRALEAIRTVARGATGPASKRPKSGE